MDKSTAPLAEDRIELPDAVAAPRSWEPIEKSTPTPLTAPQFGLRGLLFTTALIATFFGLARLIHVWALVLTFMAFVVSRIVDFSRSEPPSKIKRWTYDLLTGVLLPIGCLVYDPIFFHEPATRLVAFAVFGSQMITLFIWLILAFKFRPTTCGFFAGFLAFGALAALGVGLMMTPITMIGMLMLIGVLGLTPFFTAVTFFRHSKNAWRHAGLPSDRRLAWVMGFLAAVAIGILAFAFRSYVPNEWLKPIVPWAI